jgi:hypothetical protein
LTTWISEIPAATLPTVTATYTYGNALLRTDGETPLYDGLGSSRTVTNTSAGLAACLPAAKPL